MFHIFHIGQRRGVLHVTMLFPKGVQPQLDGWPWNCEGVLGAKGCVAAQCLVFFPTKARLIANFERKHHEKRAGSRLVLADLLVCF